MTIEAMKQQVDQIGKLLEFYDGMISELVDKELETDDQYVCNELQKMILSVWEKQKKAGERFDYLQSQLQIAFGIHLLDYDEAPPEVDSP